MSRILRLKQVSTKTGLSKSTIYEEMARGKFPKSFKISRRTVGWAENQIDKWIESKSQLAIGYKDAKNEL